MSQKADLSSLGAHFEQSLQSHQQKHIADDAAVRSRKRNVQLLTDKLSNVLGSKGLAKSGKTARYVVGDQKGNTDVSFCLSVVGITLPEAARKLLDVSGQFYNDYLDKGASYLDEDESVIDEATKVRLTREHISLYAYLETASDHAQTLDEVYVGTILDAETLLIPAETTGYIKIGPSDSRFEATLSIVSLVNDRAKRARGDVRRLKMIPSILGKKSDKTNKLSVSRSKSKPKYSPPTVASTVNKKIAKTDELPVSESKSAAIPSAQSRSKVEDMIDYYESKTQSKHLPSSSVSALYR